MQDAQKDPVIIKDKTETNTKAKSSKKKIAKDVSEASSGMEKNSRRKIPGGLPYTGSPGVLKRVLDKIPVTEKPTIFNSDFLGTVMGVTGGASRPVIPILKATGLLTQTSSPTELYSQFQTDSGRAGAALQALKNGYSEIFRRNQFAHRADEKIIVDIIIAITGLPQTDQIVRYISSTFQVLQAYCKTVSEFSESRESERGNENNDEEKTSDQGRDSMNSMQLVYNINIVLPETTNIEVFNSIFKSLRGNLLQ